MLRRAIDPEPPVIHGGLQRNVATIEPDQIRQSGFEEESGGAARIGHAEIELACLADEPVEQLVFGLVGDAQAQDMAARTEGRGINGIFQPPDQQPKVEFALREFPACPPLPPDPERADQG
ncbi:hypothetical protein R5H30_21660 [Sulfitobacter sp. D35]|uniref:hypothetical protein n=1 Tax=Sulfitobacter sp. D35 TaxID=3083252 RepID=UPI00296F27D3|nr:hypothetical protein [Sulfitobacter sp. D35]MDW4500603.1 hypothetical protein [Sulfitobacter sp. D35]